jgi:hypothetical protein
MNGVGSGTIDSFSTFLKYGPTGLAALMLVLVAIALSLQITPQRERLLKQFMYIGAFCFALALGASFFSVAGAYQLYFRVIPLDAGSRRILPLPIIKINSTTVDEQKGYLVKSEVTAVVDVTDAIDFVQQVRSQADNQRKALDLFVADSNSLVTDLQKVPQIIDRNCSGGPHGIPAASNPAVLAITANTAATIADFRSMASAAIAAPAPEVK